MGLLAELRGLRRRADAAAAPEALDPLAHRALAVRDTLQKARDEASEPDVKAALDEVLAVARATAERIEARRGELVAEATEAGFSRSWAFGDREATERMASAFREVASGISAMFGQMARDVARATEEVAAHVRPCERCGAPLGKAKFCPECGAPRPAPSER